MPTLMRWLRRITQRHNRCRNCGKPVATGVEFCSEVCSTEYAEAVAW